jgi:hypothetical protein
MLATFLAPRRRPLGRCGCRAGCASAASGAAKIREAKAARPANRANLIGFLLHNSGRIPLFRLTAHHLLEYPHTGGSRS